MGVDLVIESVLVVNHVFHDDVVDECFFFMFKKQFNGRLTCLSDRAKNAKFILFCLSVAVSSTSIVYFIFLC